MPKGFRVKRGIFLPEEAPMLGKACQAARYWLWARDGHGCSASVLLDHVKGHFGEDVLFAEVLEENYKKRAADRVSVVLANPAKNGIGGWVRALTAAGTVFGWQDLCIVRVALGRWEGERLYPLGLHPLTKEDVVCLHTGTM
jgi:hypothetical protein